MDIWTRVSHLGAGEGGGGVLQITVHLVTLLHHFMQKTPGILMDVSCIHVHSHQGLFVLQHGKTILDCPGSLYKPKGKPTLIFLCLGHRYKSRHRSNLSWINLLYAGTRRRLEYLEIQKTAMKKGLSLAHTSQPKLVQVKYYCVNIGNN